jgi:hypothetical protein
LPVLYKVIAKITLLDNIPFRVKATGVIGAGRLAITAADTLLLINYNNTIGAFPGSSGRTDPGTGRIVAVHALGGNHTPFDPGKSTHLITVDFSKLHLG